MNPNHILAIIAILIVLTLFSCLIAGDVFLNKIAFSVSVMNCDSFMSGSIISTPVSNLPAATIAQLAAPIAQPDPTIAQLAAPIAQPAPTIASLGTITNKFNIPNDACINLSTTDIGFAKFRIVMFWIMFLALTILLVFAIMSIGSINIASIVIAILGISLWTFMLVGGIYLTYFTFQATLKKCNSGNSANYCYNLSSIQLIFSRITSVLCFPMTIAFTIAMGYVVMQSI
jgi:hypothetical protein